MEAKKWYKNPLAIVLLLILFFPVGLFLMWKYTEWNKFVKIGVTIFVGIVGIAALSSDSPSKAPTLANSNNPTVVPTNTTVATNYEKMYYEELPTVENFTFYYSGEDKSEKYLESLTRKIKSEVCKKPCNINLFDDKKAAELDNAMRAIKSETEEKEWKRKNYVYVADHYPAYLEFEGDGIFFYYPYKDWAYDELKAQQ